MFGVNTFPIIIIATVLTIFGVFITPNTADLPPLPNPPLPVPFSSLNTTAYFACTNTQLTSQTIPNLAYAMTNTFFPSYNFTCETLPNLGTTSQNVTWYYYNTYPPTVCPERCPHDTADSTMTFTNNTYTFVNGNLATQGEGTITAGPFLGQKVTRTSNTVFSTQTACEVGQVGLEMVLGTVNLVIADGPTCGGVYVNKFCPGIHSQLYYTLNG